MYALQFEPDFISRLKKLDNSIRIKIGKKINQVRDGLPGRHLEHGADYFVEEVGQYRICYKSFEEKKIRRFYFVGDHKEYEKWYNDK
ncbi:hypothetical protein KJ780_02210 [Candidatus Micrarchaeota archaeon]|nr:hypothetical protein [Candidatus Micrarchaeota archaeon]